MTLYILRKDGGLTVGPQEWNRPALAKFLKTVSLPVDPPKSPARFGPFELKPVADKPAHNPLYQTCAWNDAAEQWDLAWRDILLLRAIRLKEARDYAQEQILVAAPAHVQRNAALGLLGATATAAVKKRITDWRDACNLHEGAINALETQAEVAGYDLTIGWP